MNQSFVLIVFAAAMAAPAGALTQGSRSGRAIIYLGPLDDSESSAAGYSALISGPVPDPTTIPAAASNPELTTRLAREAGR